MLADPDKKKIGFLKLQTQYYILLFQQKSQSGKWTPFKDNG